MSRLNRLPNSPRYEYLQDSDLSQVPLAQDCAYQLSEILSLIDDLGLVPRNKESRDIMQIYENEKINAEADLRLMIDLYKRRFVRKNVHSSDNGTLF